MSKETIVRLCWVVAGLLLISLPLFSFRDGIAVVCLSILFGSVGAALYDRGLMLQ